MTWRDGLRHGSSGRHALGLVSVAGPDVNLLRWRRLAETDDPSILGRVLTLQWSWDHQQVSDPNVRDSLSCSCSAYSMKLGRSKFWKFGWAKNDWAADARQNKTVWCMWNPHTKMVSLKMSSSWASSKQCVWVCIQVISKRTIAKRFRTSSIESKSVLKHDQWGKNNDVPLSSPLCTRTRSLKPMKAIKLAI